MFMTRHVLIAHGRLRNILQKAATMTTNLPTRIKLPISKHVENG